VAFFLNWITSGMKQRFSEKMHPSTKPTNTTMRYIPILFLFSTLLTGCGENEPNPISNEPVPKGDRAMGIHITQAAGEDYEAAFSAAKSVNMDVINLTFYWNVLQESNTAFNTELLQIVDLFYPTMSTPISLNITPIEAIHRSVPSDLSDVAFDDPAMIARFKQLLDTVHHYTPNTDIHVLLIGNEVDLYFNSHPKEWDGFVTFYEEVVAHAKVLWGDALPLGVELTWGAMLNNFREQGQAINQFSDWVAFTYYPLAADFTMREISEISGDMAQVMELYPNKKIFLEECGYASGPLCNSSEEMQRLFIEEIFRIWDEYEERLVFIGFLWLSDLSTEEIDPIVQDYGMAAHPDIAPFAEYLRTLGLRQYDGTLKPAYKELVKQTEARGW